MAKQRDPQPANSGKQRNSVSTTPRRGALYQLSTLLIGGLAFLSPLASALYAFFDPLRRRSDANAFIRVVSLDALPTDGIPRAFPVLADRVDAWNRFPSEPIGSVYLRRTPSGEVTAVNAVCPHAGCFVDFEAAAGRYQCPCHDSRFEPDGQRIGPNCPSPRDLDTLEVDAEKLAAGEVWVKFQNFRAGKTEKIAES